MEWFHEDFFTISDSSNRLNNIHWPVQSPKVCRICYIIKEHGLLKILKICRLKFVADDSEVFLLKNFRNSLIDLLVWISQLWYKFQAVNCTITVLYKYSFSDWFHTVAHDNSHCDYRVGKLLQIKREWIENRWISIACWRDSIWQQFTYCWMWSFITR